MKNIIFILLSIVISLSANIYAQKASPIPTNLKNKYWLTIPTEINLPLNLTFKADKDTCLPLLYSPTQSSKAIFPNSWSFRNDTLKFQNKSINISLSLIYNKKDGTFSGTIKQGIVFKVKFDLCDTIFQMKRPQTPKAPYSFVEEQVTIDAGNDVVLSGTITYPKDGKNFPAVILVSGSGQQNRDEEIFGHKPFLVIADYFAQHGIAVLRYDDRGVGKSVGNLNNATTLDFADDAEAAFNFLRKHKNINKKRVGIVGHSEGALIAQIVAARNRNVKFVAFLAGQGLPGSEILLLQNKLIFQKQNVNDTLIDIRLTCLKDFFAIADTATNKNMVKLFGDVIKEKASGLSQNDLQTCGLDKRSVFLMWQQFQTPWMKTFLKLDPADYLPKIKCPILALNGDKDLQVPVYENFTAIKKFSSGDVATCVFTNINHLFQKCETGLPSEYIIIEETFDPIVLKTLSEWILSN